MPFRYAIRFGSVPLGRRNAISAKEIASAVEASARRLPWRSVCIEKGLVVQRMLRLAGMNAILHYGVRHHPKSSKLEAHVWVTVDGRTVIGGAEASDFAPVATYP